MRNNRKLTQIINGNQTSDGDGVQLKRFIGSPELDMLDPFLLLDSFGSDQPLDYIGGFPPHPHRGFETVTYMLAGKMRHKDSAGNEGVIEAAPSAPPCRPRRPSSAPRAAVGRQRIDPAAVAC